MAGSKISSTKGISIGILIFILIVVIVYVIVIFELYKQQKFIFAPYTPPTPPSNHFFPLGNVTPLTQEQIEHRNAIIRASVGIAP
jgi:flagellar basal body-associated protein FliL